MEWVRWYHGTVTDPKWRTIARRSRQPLATVIAVWASMLESASAAANRGSLEGWDVEDQSAALDLDPEAVQSIRDAMEGKVIREGRLANWEKRNPKDATAAERKRRQRDRSVTERDRSVTPRDGPAREEAEVDTEGDTDTTTTATETRERERAISEIILAANRGMQDNPRIGAAYQPIPTSHGSRQTVHDWLQAGIPPDFARAACFRRAKEYEPNGRQGRIASMKYFDLAVREEWEQSQTEAQGVDQRKGASREVRRAEAKPDRFARLAIRSEGRTGTDG